MPYATRDDVFQLGLSAQAFAVYGKQPQSIDPAMGIIKLVAHGLTDLDLVNIETGEGADLPAPLSEFVTYGVHVLSWNTFQLTTASGIVRDFASKGEGWAIAIDPTRRLDMHIIERSGFIDEHLTAHDPPIKRDQEGKYPVVLVGLNARLAARSALPTLAFENPVYRESIERLMKTEEPDNRLLDWWMKGKPINSRPEDESAAADNGAVAVSRRDGNEWRTPYL